MRLDGPEQLARPAQRHHHGLVGAPPLQGLAHIVEPLVGAEVPDVPAGHLGGDVPVAADPAVVGGGQIPDHRTQPGQVEGPLVQRQDRPLQFQRDVPFRDQLGGQPGGVRGGGAVHAGLDRVRLMGGHPGCGFPHPCAASGRLSGTGGTFGPSERLGVSQRSNDLGRCHRRPHP